MVSFDEVMAMAALPERVVPLIVAGDHLARIAELERQMLTAPAPTNLGERSPTYDLAEQIEALQAEMAATEVHFKLRAMGGRKWDSYKLVQPVRQKDEAQEAYVERFFIWLCGVVSETCYEPKMSLEQVVALAEKLPGSSWDALTDEAWALNSGKVTVPFSAAASALTSSIGAKSRRPSESASPSVSSAATSRARRPRTSTTTKAG